jgi:predicted transposase/invertase (TIGR01784 family)
LISFDWAAKSLLRNKANFDILEGFLSALLKQDIKVLSLLESEGSQEYESDKFNRVDLVVEDANHELLVVEVQNNREVHYLERLLFGTSKLIVDHVQLGESYEKVRKVISISILYFLLGEGESDYVYHGRTEFYGLNDNSRLEFRHRNREAVLGGIESLNYDIFPEYYLIEVEKFRDIVNSDLDEWIYFLKNADIKDEFKSKNIQVARQKLDAMKMSEDERRAYERYLMNKASEKDMLLSAKLEGKLEGKDEGVYEQQVKTARKMLAKGMEISLIAEMTELSEEEIQKLKKEMD